LGVKRGSRQEVAEGLRRVQLFTSYRDMHFVLLFLQRSETEFQLLYFGGEDAAGHWADLDFIFVVFWDFEFEIASMLFLNYSIIDVFFIFMVCLETTPMKEGGKYNCPSFSTSKVGV
jgi:hypothetical protein